LTLPIAFCRMPGMAQRKIGDAVRILRKMAKLSQSALGKKAGVDRVTILRIEKGQMAPRMDTVEAIAKALKTTPSELLAA
jgi:transcriptional regulator with XRE-family HTH domain